MVAAQSVDFDDLLLKTVQLLETDTLVRQAIQARFRWISVDEYQDVNLAQVRLLRLLAGGGAISASSATRTRRSTVFAGRTSAILGIPCGVSQLPEPYNCAQAIGHPKRSSTPRPRSSPGIRIGRQRLLATFAAAVKVAVYTAPTDKAEAEYVVHQIEQLVGGTSYFSWTQAGWKAVTRQDRDFGEIAVLYRLHAQSRLLVEALERSGIPYQVGGQTLAESAADPRDRGRAVAAPQPCRQWPRCAHCWPPTNSSWRRPAALHESVAGGKASLSHSLESWPSTRAQGTTTGEPAPVWQTSGRNWNRSAQQRRYWIWWMR